MAEEKKVKKGWTVQSRKSAKKPWKTLWHCTNDTRSGAEEYYMDAEWVSEDEMKDRIKAECVRFVRCVVVEP